MSNRRQHQRSTRRIPVRFWRCDEPDKVHQGFTKDLSANGAFIVTTSPVGNNTRIRVELLDGDGGGFLTEAIVRRARRIHRELEVMGTSGMGVRFLGIADFLEGPIANDGASVPASAAGPRPLRPDRTPSKDPSSGDAVPPVQAVAPSPSDISSTPASAMRSNEVPVEVHFRNTDELRQIFERDLRHGGLFIATPNPSPAGTRIRVALRLPGADAPLVADARVIQVFEPDAIGPRARRQVSGMGVLFEDATSVLAHVRALIGGSDPVTPA